MVFSSTVFLFLFLPLLLVLYYFPRAGRTWRNTILLLASIFFYAWGEPVFVFLMLFSVFVNWALALGMDRASARRKAWLTGAVIFDILLLGVFKYASFLSRNLVALTGNEQLIVSIALPIGISFFTFQLMSYVFDVYYGKAGAQKNLLHVALYIALFPQLIAGPIVRYAQIEDEILNRHESFSLMGEGIRRFVYGLAKKVLLANFLAQIADNAFDYAVNPSVLYSWLGAVAYTLQIYFDFSGYSDMAIGLGKLFGFHFPENFDYPYMAGSVTEYWKRWHISLGSWFRDYVYIPLGGNRVSKPKWVRNLFTVWLLTGIWHGANWTFVLWGLIYFAVLLLEKTTGSDRKNSVLTRLRTLLTVTLAFVIFRSVDVASGLHYLGVMFGLEANGFLGSDFLSTISGTWLVLVLALLGATPLLARTFRRLADRGLGWTENLWLTAVFAATVLEITGSTYNPFIYFNF